jgi:3-methylfumaryl-CoA hydratase
VLSTQDKQGRSGTLTFVPVHHQVLQRGNVVIDEQQDLVYRSATPPAGPGATLADGPVLPPGDGKRATLLFRFSALTYNAHRIHDDRPYARGVEGYPGLLTHGPVQELAMAEAARAAGYPAGDGDLAFDYRLTSPLFDHQGMAVSATWGQDAIATTVRDVDSRRTATGTLRSSR